MSRWGSLWERSRLSIWLGVLLVLNLGALKLSERLSLRLDLSPHQRYTLAYETRALVTQLIEPLSIDAFLPLSAPPPYRQVVTRAQDLLEAYQRESRVPFRLQIHDSAGAEGVDAQASLRERAERFSIRESALMIRQGDRQVQLTIPFGVAFESGSQSAVAPPPERPEDIEYLFTRALRVAVEAPPKLHIGVSQGYGEPQLLNSPLAQRLGSLGELHPVRLDEGMPERSLDALLILAPRRPFGAQARTIIEQLALRGTSLILFLDYRQQSAALPEVWIPQPSGLESLLGAWGIEVESRWVVADEAHPGLAPLRRDARSQVALAEHPIYPITEQLAAHPISDGWSRLLFPMGVPLKLSPPARPLIWSEASANAYHDLRSLQLSDARAQRSGPHVLAATLDGVLNADVRILEQNAPSLGRPTQGSSAAPELQFPLISRGQGSTRVVLFSSGARLLSAHPEHLLLLERSIEWGLREEHLGALRSRQQSGTPLRIDASARHRLRLLLHFCPLLLLFIFTALLRWRARRSR